MKNIYPLLCFILLIPFTSFSQNPAIKIWDKRFGGAADDWVSCFQQTADGGYILGGSSKSPVGGDKTQAAWPGVNNPLDYWIVKIDAMGNKQWDKVFGGTKDDYLTCLQQTTDGGYILGGYSASPASGDKTQGSYIGGLWNYDYWIVKTDAAGNKQWDKDFGSTDDDELLALLQTKDGGYLFGGRGASIASGNKTAVGNGSFDFWVIKTDSAGTRQWEKNYGGFNDEILNSMIPTADGGYMFAGYSSSGIYGDRTEANRSTYGGTSDYWIIKVDASGTKQWDKSFGGEQNDYCYAIRQTADHGYILAGQSNSPAGGDKTDSAFGGFGDQDYWLVKTDSTGAKQWDKIYGGTSMEWDIPSISITKDGGYLLSGSSESRMSGNKSEDNWGYQQSWIVKTDASGNIQWDKTLRTTATASMGLAAESPQGGCFTFVNYSAVETGGYKTQLGRGGDDYWVVKFCDSAHAAVAPPIAAFMPADTVICANDCITLTDLSLNTPTSWLWTIPNSYYYYYYDQNPEVCFPYGSNDPVEITLVASNALGSDTITKTIIVNPLPPAPALTLLHDTIFSSDDPSYIAYQWYKEDSIINGATGNYFVPDTCGNYALKVTNINACCFISTIKVVLTVGCNPLGVNDPGAGLLSVSPNPAADELFIRTPTDGPGEVSLFNTIGMLIYSKQIHATNHQATIDVSSLPPGIYFIEISGREKIMKGRFVKE